ncbi:hypothetical protein O0555_11010 [Brevibacillus laterosporus]|uniref:hypothetical protein n=1 Tax=Brevibacillus laterosporus TaxID=1465 RepID=UPI000CE55981|nr:hypothetical protein [Brevibacillus laterosporus]MBG9800210.1 hypothetical protein [Brevibacillus laterosporus]MCR8937877.1 hypothetical protein [Brevibacillus laterosporus]MCZ0840516.1 hypothetical protein [Brevibacillus laterosporus]MCZ0847430.1 hypothetical protein [Brevibacillus laterosporus]MED1911254.1 hypothetical protein [Brevibacillus laterosporus]
MNKILVMFLTALLFVSSFASISLGASKPSGNYCGSDKTKLGISSDSIKYFDRAGSFEYNGQENNVSSIDAQDLFNTFQKKKEANVCLRPEVVEDYHNNTKLNVTYTFTAKGSKSTGYNTNVSAGFLQAFQGTMGYSAENTVERSSGFSVVVPPKTSVELSQAVSARIIEGLWNWGTGKKDITVTYPTYITWITK